jgi:hypothetical protein
MEDNCEVCMAGNCCAELQACAKDQGCTCYEGCLDGGKDPDTCAQECVVKPDEDGPIAQLDACEAKSCADEC